MSIRFRKLLAFLSIIQALVCLQPATAEPLTVATAAVSNTYDLMVRQLAVACQQEVPETIVGRPSTGSMDNVSQLLENEVPAAIVQSDVLSYRQRQDDLGSLKALFVLHPEQVHLLALAEPPRSEGLAKMGALIGIGRKRLTSFADLRGRKVGAWGGSIVTARFIRVNTEVEFKLEEFDNETSALKALGTGSVDALLSVGGYPQPWIKELDKRHRLIPFADAEIARLKGFYRPAKLSYSRMGQIGVTTVSTDAVLVVHDYRTPPMASLLMRTRECFRSHLLEIQEKPGNHAAWQAVSAETKPLWPQYTPPNGSALPKTTRRPTRQTSANIGS